MSDVVNRTTKEYKISVHTNDYSELDWIINPNMSRVGGVDPKYWKIEGDLVLHMTAEERDVVDLSELPAIKLAKKESLVKDSEMFMDSLGYSKEVQGTLVRLFSESDNARPNRNKYIKPWVRWITKAEDHVQKKLIEVDSRVTANQVNNVSLNYVLMENGDPKITVSVAMDTLDPENIANFLDSNAEVSDPQTGIVGPFQIMQTLQMRKDLYNDNENPLYFASHTPILGNSGILQDHANRVANLENIHSKMGWHHQEVLKGSYKSPKTLLIYYGWVNSFNSATNAWTNELVAQDMACYSLVVLGDGVQDPTHGDFANTTIVINRIKVLNPSCKIFGYVSLKQTAALFETKASQWNALGVYGIFIDEAGYDFGKNRRFFNNAVDYVHALSSSRVVFANAWNTNHLIGIEEDVSFPNATFNANLVASTINEDDWILLESFPVNTLAYSGNYCDAASWLTRATRAISARLSTGVNLAASCVINNTMGAANGNSLFKLGYISAMMCSLDAYGSSDHNYGSSSAAVKSWVRTGFADYFAEYTITPNIIANPLDIDTVFRYIDGKRLFLDFSTGVQLSGAK